MEPSVKTWGMEHYGILQTCLTDSMILHGEDPRIRALFATIKKIRAQWGEQEWAYSYDDGAQNPPEQLEDECFDSSWEREHVTAHEFRRRKSSQSVLAKSESSLQVADSPGQAQPFDIDKVEMTEEQRKMFNDVLADIEALEINTASTNQEFCPQNVCETKNACISS